MVFSRFIWTILLMIVVIVFTAIGLGYFIQVHTYPVSTSLMILLLIAEAFYMLFYLGRIRRDLLKLINALRHEDPTLQFSKEKGDPYFSSIHKGFNEIIKNFRLVRLDKEAEHQFFKATVDHIQFGIISFYENGEVELVNTAFLKLFGIKNISLIDELNKTESGLSEKIRRLEQGEESLARIMISGRQHHLIFLASRFRIMQQQISLISVRDISREIDRNELEAWQKLIRILRHEILNSVTPIKLLSGNLSGMLPREGETISLKSLSETEVADMKTGLETIHRRATGLSRFLDAYSNLYSVPELQMLKADVKALLKRVAILFTEQFSSNDISLTIECRPTGLHIELDERMIEQVLINLVKNAVDAVRNSAKKSIILSGSKVSEDLVISVADNGSGIPEDQIDNIFIPFYSTRSEGSGIGLSFSQHVMRLHGGYITVLSSPGTGSEFRLVFQK